ncbi:MAG: hypothetical protein ABUT20_16845 [Bacteroidota bacterium]
MRNSFIAILFLLFAICCRSQQLSQVTFANASTLSWFSFSTDQGILIRVSDEGKILEWGTELASERSSNYYAPKLQPYMGRVTYFDNDIDSVIRGKIRSIGTCSFTYYGAYEVEEKRGRLKSIGRINLDYFSRYENINLKGKLRIIGSDMLDYYSQFESEGVKGKLKSIGTTTIAYNSVFEDKLIQGKVKSIGSVSFNWGTSLDIRYAGSLKSGLYRQNINGIVYILR